MIESDSSITLRSHIYSFLGKNSLIKGEMHLTGDVKICSEIIGELHVQEGHLFIEREGNVQGKVQCTDIEITGKFSGEIKSSGKVVLWPCSKVSGQIQAKSIVIYPGACADIEAHTLTENPCN